MVDGAGPLPDSYRELFLIIGLIGFVGFQWFTNPAFIFQVEETVDNTFSYIDTGGEFQTETLSLTKVEAQRLNQNEQDTSFELGYCIQVDTQGDIDFELADTVESSTDSITFLVSTCNFDAVSKKGTLHTQPTSTDLSLQDKKSFINSGFDYSCVQSGPITTQEGEGTVNLKCYKRPVDNSINSRFPEVPVKIG